MFTLPSLRLIPGCGITSSSAGKEPAACQVTPKGTITGEEILMEKPPSPLPQVEQFDFEAGAMVYIPVR
jgi:hypothetical protein